MEFSAIGLMSGTSLDGLDLCYAHFTKEDSHWNFKIECAETIIYSPFWENKLKHCMNSSAPELLQLNSEYGFYLGKTVRNFISKNNINKLDVIASHGHTVYHQPLKKFTTQIGDGRAIKITNNVPVVYDFRSQDVLMGGNGAPLVPIGDYHLFSQYEACINLGGFSNISYTKNDVTRAFDICPVNIVLNRFAQQLGEKYDNQGSIASSGQIQKQQLNILNELKYYKDAPPKSLGLEWVEENIFPVLHGMKPENALATFTHHAACQIANTIEELGLTNAFITGGGAFNTYMLNIIRSKTSAELIIPEDNIIHFKEALIFGFMGVLKLNNENNVLSSATGSVADHCTGLLV